MGRRGRGVGAWSLAATVGTIWALTTGCGSKPVDVQKSLQEQFITAKPGSVIDLPEGKIHLNQTLSLMVDHVTLRGKGMDKTILSFAGSPGGVAAGQIESGQGLLIKANDFTIEDLAIEDTAGDALTIQGGTNITIRRVRAEWTRGSNEQNGPYGIYPVECKNLLIEDSIARGAADAGIYVGQDENVIVRRNRSEQNVDGYEIENSENVDAYENVSTHNVGGMGVFNLPNWQRQGGHNIRVFKNTITENNTPNFAPKMLGPIHGLPSGTGLYIMAIRDVEVFQNKIQNNNTANVYVINYSTGVEEGVRDTASSVVTQQIFAPPDKRFYPFDQAINIHDNEISGGGSSPDQRYQTMKDLVKASGGRLPDIVYDGLTDSQWKVSGPDPGQICLKGNGQASFANFNLSNKTRGLDHKLKNYECTLPALASVTLAIDTSKGSQGSGQ